MLEFHVTEEIFNLVKSGNKLHEYRDFSKYWIKRLSKIQPPIYAFIVRGYTKDKIKIIVENISVIPREYIDVLAYKDFIKKMYCYDIEYKLIFKGSEKDEAR